MQLDLKSEWKSCLQNPCREFSRLNFSEDRRDEYGTALREPMSGDAGNRPIEILSIGDDEFHLVNRFQMLKIRPVIGGDFARAGRLEIHDDSSAWINRFNVDGTAGFEKHCATGIGQSSD